MDWFKHSLGQSRVIELIEAEFGLKGYAAVYKLFEHIYGGNGYFCDWEREDKLLFARKIGFSPGKVRLVHAIVGKALKYGLFCQELYNRFKILSSAEIQSAFFDASKRRKEVPVEGRYIICDGVPSNVKLLGEERDRALGVVSCEIRGASICADTHNSSLTTHNSGGASICADTRNSSLTTHNSEEGFFEFLDVYQNLVESPVSQMKVGAFFGFYDKGLEAGAMVEIVKYAAAKGGRYNNYGYIHKVMENSLKGGRLSRESFLGGIIKPAGGRAELAEYIEVEDCGELGVRS